MFYATAEYVGAELALYVLGQSRNSMFELKHDSGSHVRNCVEFSGLSIRG